MIIRYDVTGKDRKRLAKALSKITLWEAEYAGAPSFAYKVGNYTIDRNGAIECPSSATREVINRIINMLREDGFNATELVGDRLVITIPKDTISQDELVRLRQIILNKATLFERAFKTNVISLEDNDDKLSFPWFTVYGEDGEAKAYTDFVFALLNMAKQKKRIIAKPYDGDNDKFTMRLFLVQLGLKGEKYKNTRKILLRYLTGNSAWRNGVSHESEGLK